MTKETDKEIWTSEELLVEFQHRLETRLAILCGLDEPTAEQLAMAMEEADEACEILKGQQ